MLQALRLEADSGGGASIAEDVLGIMETVLQEATSTPTPAIPIQQGDGSQLDMLLDRITSPYVVHYACIQFTYQHIDQCLTTPYISHVIRNTADNNCEIHQVLLSKRYCLD